MRNWLFKKNKVETLLKLEIKDLNKRNMNGGLQNRKLELEISQMEAGLMKTVPIHLRVPCLLCWMLGMIFNHYLMKKFIQPKKATYLKKAN